MDEHTRLSQTATLLEALLRAAEPHQLEAFCSERIDDANVTLGDVTAARQLLLDVVRALQTGGPEAWRRVNRAHVLAAAAGALELAAESTLVSKTVDASQPVTTKSSAADSMHRQRYDVPEDQDVPASSSLDETIPIGEWQTIAISEAAAAAPPGSEPRTQPSGPTTQEPVDVDKYAVLCAWSQLYPDRRTSLNRQYGLEDESQRRALDERMESLFTQDLALRAAFAQRLQMHLRFLQKK